MGPADKYENLLHPYTRAQLLGDPGDPIRPDEAEDPHPGRTAETR